MMTMLAVERLGRPVKNYKLILSSLSFAYGVSPVVAYLVAGSMLKDYPDLFTALILVGTIPCSTYL